MLNKKSHQIFHTLCGLLCAPIYGFWAMRFIVEPLYVCEIAWNKLKVLVFIFFYRNSVKLFLFFALFHYIVISFSAPKNNRIRNPKNETEALFMFIFRSIMYVICNTEQSARCFSCQRKKQKKTSTRTITEGKR